MNSKNITPSEWQMDELGRRFRMIGNIKEFEATILTSNGAAIPQSQLEEFTARQRAAAEANREAEKAKTAPALRCPFSERVDRRCTPECALYTTQGCGIVHGKHEENSAGKACPLSPYKCDSSCALYDGGCVLRKLRERINHV